MAQFVPSRTILTLSVQNGPACSKSALEKLGPIWPLGSIWVFSFYSASFEFFIDFNFVGSGVHSQATAHSQADQSFTLGSALSWSSWPEEGKKSVSLPST